MIPVTATSRNSDAEAVTNNDFYVYALITEGTVFYVGKGHGNRLRTHGYLHATGAAAQAVRAIVASGQSWQAVTLAAGLDEGEAFRRERAFLNLVDPRPLANVQGNPWLAYLRARRLRPCHGCGTFFSSSRRDRMTCSERCQKRRQRARTGREVAG